MRQKRDPDVYENGETPMVGDLVQIISRFTVVELKAGRVCLRHDDNPEDDGWVEPSCCRLLARAEAVSLVADET